MDFSQRYQAFRDQLKDYPDVTVIAVTKYATLDDMVAAYQSGIRHFGENRVQNALEKQGQLPAEIMDSVQWHLIGHLQSNKTAKTVGKFTLIHSVDSLALLEKLSQLNAAFDESQKVLLQVNLSGEATKSGFTREDMIQSFKVALALPGVQVMGLMTMAPHSEDKTYQRQLFQGLADLKSQLEDEHQCPLPVLSMGMSNDFEVALACGATHIRIGSRLFGS